MDLLFRESFIQYTMTAGTQNELQKDLSLHYKKPQSNLSLLVMHRVGVHKASGSVFQG